MGEQLNLSIPTLPMKARLKSALLQSAVAIAIIAAYALNVLVRRED
jgi:hypothetical protein